MKLNCHNLLQPQSCNYIIDTMLVSMLRSAAHSIMLTHFKSHPKFSSLSNKDRYTLRITSCKAISNVVMVICNCNQLQLFLSYCNWTVGVPGPSTPHSLSAYTASKNWEGGYSWSTVQLVILSVINYYQLQAITCMHLLLINVINVIYRYYNKST